jgi:hypothetical protein
MPKSKRKRKLEEDKRTAALVKQLREVGSLPPINENFFYRLQLLPLFIGLGRSQINEGIINGDLPPPLAPTEGGRARGYLGRQILQIQADLEAKAKKEEGK